MQHSSQFEITLPANTTIKFEQGYSFENFVGQFQQSCLKLLCVVDGTDLRFYDKPSMLPKNIRFDYKQQRENITEYYFRDIITDSLYCVFGREAAKIFYPRIDEVDPIRERIVTSRPQRTTNNTVTIIDRGVELRFPDYDYPVTVLTHCY